jgi:hypothetical protein
MLFLRAIGLRPRHPQAIRACRILLDNGSWTDGGINLLSTLAEAE